MKSVNGDSYQVRAHEAAPSEGESGQVAPDESYLVPPTPETSDVDDLGRASEGAPKTRPIATNMGEEDAEATGHDHEVPQSLLDSLKTSFTRSSRNIGNEAADAAVGLGGAAVQGARALHGALKHAALRAISPAATVFGRAGGAVASALGVPKAVGNGVTAGLVALAVACGATALSGNGFNHALFTAPYEQCVYDLNEQASSSFGAAEGEVPETLNGHPLGDVYTVCVNLDTYSYPAGTQQRYWQDQWKATGREMTNELPTINGRYLIACTSKYGEMGDMIDFYLDDGTVIPCVKVEAKAEEVAPWDPNPANEWGHQDGRCILEFQWCTGSGYDTLGTNPGNGYFEELSGHRVAGWTNRGAAADGSSVIDGASNSTKTASNKNAADALDACAKRTTTADNSSAATAMASYSYSKRATLGEGYRGTELWLKVFHEVFPGDPWERSCDRGVATALRWSGTDMDVPAGATGAQLSYFENSPKWEKVSSNGAAFESSGEVQPGDVFVMNGHIKMYIGNEILQQVYDTVIKGTDGDLGAPTSDMVYCEASIGSGQGSPDSRAPCYSNWMCAADNRDPYQVFRCVQPDESDEFDDFSVAGMTTSNSASLPMCECRIIEEDNSNVGEEIADLAVAMAATASPEERIKGPNDDPWEDIGDPRLDNLVTIVDATLGAWGGNDAYASCCQASCAVIAAAADPDIAPSNWPGSMDGNSMSLVDDPWEEGMGGSQGVIAALWYCKARPEIYEEVGESLSEDELEPGDLMISNTHVMIYVGNEAAKKRFSDSDANMYEASFADGVGGTGDCFYAGLTHRSDFSGFTVFRLKGVNKDAAHDTLDWESMIDTSRVR